MPDREDALIRLLFAFLGGLAGALITAPVLAMIAAQVINHLNGTPKGFVTVGGELGGLAGLLLGFGIGIWLVLRQQGRFAGTALTWLWVGALLLMGCLGFVAFS
jgi:hypothetical protein